MKRVLFSPIGSTDPTRGNYDGPLLHIIRYYNPEKVYIFLTKEMAEFDEQDNRYEIMCQHVKEGVELIKEVHKDVDRPNEFLIFDDKFKKILNKIKKENPDCEILINITSGTTQINASLYMLASTLTFPVKLVQVDTPERGSNKNFPIGKNYDIGFEKKNLLDDHQDEEIINRCREIIPENVIRQNMINSIISHLNAYDYEAAKIIVELEDDFFSKEIKDLLRMAEYRSELNHIYARKIAQKYNYCLYPIESSDVQKQFEYILYLIKTQKKNRLNDFVRAISPILVNLFMDLIDKKTEVNIKTEYCVLDRKNNIFILKRDKLFKNEEMLTYYDQSDSWKGDYKDSVLSAANILPMISYFAQNDIRIKSIEGKCKTLRDIEQNIRNRAAHEIIAISEEDFLKHTGVNSEKIVNILKEVFEFVYDHHKKNINWDSYDEMNQFLIHKINTIDE